MYFLKTPFSVLEFIIFSFLCSVSRFEFIKEIKTQMYVSKVFHGQKHTLIRMRAPMKYPHLQ